MALCTESLWCSKRKKVRKNKSEDNSGKEKKNNSSQCNMQSMQTKGGRSVWQNHFVCFAGTTRGCGQGQSGRCFVFTVYSLNSAFYHLWTPKLNWLLTDLARFTNKRRFCLLQKHCLSPQTKGNHVRVDPDLVRQHKWAGQQPSSPSPLKPKEIEIKMEKCNPDCWLATNNATPRYPQNT